MTVLSIPGLQQLLKQAEGYCASVYMPTYEMGDQTQQNPIRLKNALSQLETKLTQIGLEPEQVERFLEPGWQLVDQYEFWQHQRSGLALFLTQSHCTTYQLPVSVEEIVTVSKQFYIRPILPLLTRNGSYYVLAASQNNVRLFQANRDTIELLDVDPLTSSIAEALKYDDPEQQIQFHSAGSPMYHGQGSGSDVHDTDILRFFQAVDRDLQNYFEHSEDPLVFVGVDYLFPIYKRANHYRSLLDISVETNPDQMNAQEIHQKTWPLVEPVFQQNRRDAIAAYMDRVNTQETVSDLLDVLNAAHDGQVETLFLSDEINRWGHYDAKKRQFEAGSKTDPNHEELLNLAAIYTINCSGTVYTISASEELEDCQIAASLRYPMPNLVVAN